jgi:hypothetical protein
MMTRTSYKAILGAISVCLLLASPMAMADKASGAHKLGGVWIARVVNPITPVPSQWSYVVVADPSGTRASGYGSVDMGFNTTAILGNPYFDPTDSASPILIEIVRTGPDTAAYNAVYYGLKKLDPTSPINAAIVYIGVVKGELKFIGPDKAEGTHNFELYYPEQDANGDGLPDEGQTTPFTFTLETVDTRLPAP